MQVYLKYLDANKLRDQVGKSELTLLTYSVADYPAMSFFSTMVTTANSTNKNPNANKLSWVINTGDQ